jgi:hypothetical protein
MLFATWFTAVATGVLAIFAAVTAVFARRAFNKQSEQLKDQQEVNREQVGVLRLQSDDLKESLVERKREADERRRAQAETVDVTWAAKKSTRGDERWPDMKSLVTVTNGSRRPIRDVHCHTYEPDVDGDNHAIRAALELIYCGELIPDPAGGSFATLPKREVLMPRWIPALRGGGQAGFEFWGFGGQGRGYRVEFTDDADNRWSLETGLSLRFLGPAPASA